MIDIYFPSAWDGLCHPKLEYFLQRHPLYCAFGRMFLLATGQLMWRCVITATGLPTNDELAAARATANPTNN